MPRQKRTDSTNAAPTISETPQMGGADTDALRAENAALRATQDQMLDVLADMQGQLKALSEGGVRQAEPEPDDVQAQLDREQADLMAEFKDLPNIEVLERRLSDGSVAAPALRLKAGPGGIPEPTVAEDPHSERCYWKLRWFNFTIEGRAEKFAAEGYLKVLKEELQDVDAIPNLSSQDQYVRKGERGQEVLGKIPRKLYEFKKKRDAHRQGRMMTSESQLRDHLSNRVASMAGRTGGNADQAGSHVHGKNFSLNIKKLPTETITA